jgi:uncharacterized membrane protein
MNKNRVEAFSDGVLAIIITIMVLELKVPHGATLSSLREVFPVFVSYVLSFVYIGIYWNNHHHLLHASHSVNGKILWANLHLLFWLSLVPFSTAWMGENKFTNLPVGLYGLNLLFAAIAYFILSKTLVSHHGKDSFLSRAVGKDTKGFISVVIYFVAVGMSLIQPWVSFVLYWVVAVLWFVPDTRIEQHIKE